MTQPTARPADYRLIFSMPATAMHRACDATAALPNELAGQWMLIQQGHMDDPNAAWTLWANDPNHATEAAYLAWNGRHPRRA